MQSVNSEDEIKVDENSAREALEKQAQDAVSLHRLDSGRARQMAEEVLHQANAMGFTRCAARARFALGLADFAEGASDQAVACMQVVCQDLEPEADQDPESGKLLANVRGSLGAVLCMRGEFEDALPILNDALLHWQRTDEHRRMSGVHNSLANLYSATGALQEAVHHYTESIRIGRQTDSSASLLLGSLNRASLFLRLGETEAALQDIEEMLTLGAEVTESYRSALLAVRAEVRLAQGDLVAARQAVDAAHDEGRRAPDLYDALRVLSADGAVSLAEGDPSTALATFRRAQDYAAANGHGSMALPLLEKEVEALLALGLYEEARLSCDRGLQEAEGSHNLALQGAFHQALADLHERVGDYEQALYHYRRHVEYERAQERQKAHFQILAQNARLEIERARAALEHARQEAIRERQRREEVEELNQRLEVANQENQELVERLREMANRDPLTGLFNRRFLNEFLEAQFAQADGNSIAVAVSDVDRFKLINDGFSHLVGDEVIRAVASLFRSQCRAGDIVARLGGDEMVTILPGASPEEAYALCERIRVAVNTHNWSTLHPDLKVTVSIGVSCLPVARPEEAIALADAQLYAAKRAGRNTVCIT